MNLLETQQQVIELLSRINELLAIEETIASRRRNLEDEVTALKIKLENYNAGEE